MSWLFSQALAEEYLVENSLDGEQSVQSSGKPTQQAYCAPDKMTDFSRLSRFGMTYKPLTENLGEELLMSYREAFRAKTSPQRARGLDLKESVQDSGEKWLGSFAKYDPATHSLRTHQCSLFEDSTEYCATLPRWGSMRTGECWEQTMLEQNTNVTESGLWPTPTTPTGGGNCGGSGAYKNALKNGTHIPHSINPNLYEWLMGWPQGWTDLKPLATDKSHFVPQPLGES